MLIVKKPVFPLRNLRHSNAFDLEDYRCRSKIHSCSLPISIVLIFIYSFVPVVPETKSCASVRSLRSTLAALSQLTRSTPTLIRGVDDSNLSDMGSSKTRNLVGGRYARLLFRYYSA